MKKYFNISNFDNAPYNWSDICDTLNREMQDRITELEEDGETVDVEALTKTIWSEYKEGKVPAEYRQFWSVEVGPNYDDDTFTSGKLADCFRYLYKCGYYAEDYLNGFDFDNEVDWRLVLISVDRDGCVSLAHEIVSKEEVMEASYSDYYSYLYNGTFVYDYYCDAFSGESFGADCPDNWKEICEYLNSYIENIRYDEDKLVSAVDELWEDYCRGDLPYAPKGIYDGPEYKEYDTHIEVPHFYPKDYNLIRADGNGIVYYVLDSRTEYKYIVFEWDLSPQEEKELVDKFESYCLTQSDFQNNEWKEGDFYEWAEEEKFGLEHLA